MMRSSNLHLIPLFFLLFIMGCAAPISPTPEPTHQVSIPATETPILRTPTLSLSSTISPSVIPETPTETLTPSSTPFDLASLPQGEWIQLADMPSARSETAAVVSDGLIYVPGGVGNGSYNMARGIFVYPPGFSTAMEAFDPQMNTWQKLARMPEPRHHLMTAALDNRIYVFGGGSLCDGVCPDLPTALAYEIASDTWVDLAPMPEYRYAGAAVALNEFVYVIGGYGDTPADTLRYDPSNDAWERLTPINQPREHTAAVSFDGKIYVFGGRWDIDLASVEIYDPSSNTWTMGSSMKQPRAGHGAAVVGNQIFVAGGELILSGTFDTVLSTVEVYNPATNNWGKIIELPNGIHGVPAAGVDGIFFLLGGSESAGIVANQGTVWAYRP